jgi:hypothetical protein
MRVKVELSGFELVEGIKVKVYRNSIKGLVVRKDETNIYFKLQGEHQFVEDEQGLVDFPLQAVFTLVDPLTYLKNNL